MTNPTNQELLARISHLENLLSQQGATVPEGGDESNVDIWFLLDRSGSMSAIADNVVVGFDTFFAEQKAQNGSATVTLVQFDGDAPHDVLVDAKPLAAVRSIRGRFTPRGMTPLYDAIGMILDRAERHVAAGGHPADQLVVIFSDGAENASSHWTRRRIDERIANLRAAGWTFVFLGANQDSYETGGQMSMAAGSTANFAFSPAGVAGAYSRLSENVSAYRRKARPTRVADEAKFWAEAGKPED